MLGLHKETIKNTIHNDNSEEIAVSVGNLGTGKMNVHKGIQVIIITKVIIITRETTTTTIITKVKESSTVWRTPLLLPFLLHLPITTIIWSSPMLKECRNNYSG
jgi:uncharacterized membrane protein